MRKILKLLFGISLLMFCTLQANAQNVKFIQVTDVHLTQTNKSRLDTFVNDINQKYSNKDIDFVVFTGDNIDKARIEDLDLFLHTIKKLNFKTYVTLGNHDVFKSQGLDKKLYMNEIRKDLGTYHPNKPNYVFKDKDIVFVVMDGVKEVIPGQGGYYKDSELTWLDKQLTKYKNNRVVIIQHFPLLDARTRVHKLYKKENYLEVLAKHDNVLAIISGHYHYNQEEFQNGVYNIVTHKFFDNSSYKIIEIDSKLPMVYTQLHSNDVNTTE